MRIFHATTPADWARARSEGSYRVSTRGVTLDQEGYIHCSDVTQIADVVLRAFDDVDDVILLVIDTDLLTSPWRIEQMEGVDQPYPHIYGPLNLDAVVEVREP